MEAGIHPEEVEAHSEVGVVEGLDEPIVLAPGLGLLGTAAAGAERQGGQKETDEPSGNSFHIHLTS